MAELKVETDFRGTDAIQQALSNGWLKPKEIQNKPLARSFIIVGDLSVASFEIEIGAMGYGFDIDGIIGMDFLTHVGAMLDLSKMEIFAS